MTRFPASGPPRIGIVSIADATKGLWRDARCLMWALGDRAPEAALSVFCCRGFGRLGRDLRRLLSEPAPEPLADAVPAGMALDAWTRTLRRVVLVASSPVEPMRVLLAAGLDVVSVPNLDSPDGGAGVEEWIRSVRHLEEIAGASFEVWAKTQSIATRLRKVGIRSELVPWSIPDPVLFDRRVREDAVVTFLINAGMGGVHGRRGVDIAVRAFVHALSLTKQRIQLVVKTIRPCREYLAPELSSMLADHRVRVIESFLDRAALRELHRVVDVVLYPSRWEGFGLSLLEALHCGVPVIATDGDPMNELVRGEHTGLLVPARQAGWMRLAPHWECDPETLAAAMARVADAPDLRARLTCADPAALLARQESFRETVQRRLLPGVQAARDAR